MKSNHSLMNMGRYQVNRNYGLIAAAMLAMLVMGSGVVQAAQASHNNLKNTIKNQNANTRTTVRNQSAKIQAALAALQADIAALQAGLGEGNHTLRWDKRLRSDDGVVGGERNGCDSSRFKCIFDDTAVLDLETGLVWERSLGTDLSTWDGAILECLSRPVGGRLGWRLPSIHEILTLGIATTNNLPPGHPFAPFDTLNPTYWTATIAQPQPAAGQPLVWVALPWGPNENVGNRGPSETFLSWCVRGGGPLAAYGHISY